jgi:uncharacterized sporulation protein YeaH/YhbH (DUF444 family)
VRTLRDATGRRIAASAPYRAKIRELQARLDELLRDDRTEIDPEVVALRKELARLKLRIEAITFIDDFDLRYHNRIRIPQPSTQAVMFCLMDVSGSMDEQKKQTAKRFFMLLYLCLKRSYEKIELVFIRHHTQAQEVNENDFFHATETGGTVVSSALVLLDEIIQARYPTSEWNLYVAQASDGDNWHHDSSRCREIMEDKILPLVRYYAYVQVAQTEQNLWDEYLVLAEQHKHFAMRKVLDASQIYPVFRELFKKEGVDA